MPTTTQLALRSLLALCLCALPGLTSSAPAPLSILLEADHDTLRLLESTDQGFSVAYSFSRIEGFDVETDRGSFTYIGMPGLSHSTRIGEPKLPVSRKIFAVPLEAEVTTSVIGYVREEIVLGDHELAAPLMPAQPSLSKSQRPEDVPFAYNETSYAVRGYGERPLVSVEELGILRGVRLFMLSVEPVRYDPARNTLEVYNDLEIRVTFLGGDLSATRELRQTTSSPYYEAIYQNTLLNYGPQEERDDLTRYPIGYIIVADPMFESQLQPFFEWKTKQGFKLFVGYVGDPGVGSTTSSIKSYIQGIYDSEDPKPTFVLFVGDEDQVPAWNGNTGGHITDLHYVRLTGSDYMPEMYYGRFSARDTDELQPQIDKTLEYEQYLMPDPDFLGEAVMIAGMDANYAALYGNGQINYGTTYYFNTTHGIYSHTYLYPESGSHAADIVNDVSNGVGYANYTAHGSQTSWSNPSFTIANINSLENASEYPTVVGNCCLTNAFDTGTCFGEAWLRAESKGAIGYIGGTNSTYWDEDYWWGVGAGTPSTNPTYETTGPGAYDGMFHDHGEPFPEWYTTQYAFIMAGNLAVVEAGSSRINYYWEIYALMGDPSLATYFSVPSTNIVTYPDAILIGINQIDVTADMYSYVGLSKDGELYAAGLVDQSGQITLEFDPFTEPGQADLVITRQNREPVITTIDIIPNAGSYVIVDSTFVDDSASGNSDWGIDIGESADLSVFLKNVGNQQAPAVSGSLFTAASEVTVTDPVQNYGDLGSGETGGSSAPYGIELGTVDDGTALLFSLIITAGDSVWTRSFSLVAQAPVLAEAGWQIQDPGGNGNGRADPGETVDLSIVVANSGSGDAQDAQLTLDDTDPYVTITGPATQSLGGVPAGGQVTSGVFVVTFDADCPEAYPAVIPLQFTANGGAYNASATLTLIVGQKELLFVDTDNEATEGAIVTALNAWGGTYTRLNAYNQETVLIDTLLSYRMILWAAGDQNTSSMTSANQTNMAAYLDQGGLLLFSGENYLSSYGSSSFTSDYLHISSHQTSISGTTVYGETGDPIGDDVTVTLSYPTGLAEFPDRVTPDAEASVVFRMQGSNDPVAIRYPGGGTRAYKTIFFGAPLEAFPVSGTDPNNVQTVVARALNWLEGGDIIAPTTPQNVELAADGTLSWSPSADNIGVDHYCIYRRTYAYYDVDGIAPVRVTTSTSELFPGSVGNPDTNYYFRVTAVDEAENESIPSAAVGEHDFQVVD